MALDAVAFGRKLQAYRGQRQLTVDELSDYTGIPAHNLSSFEVGSSLPSGDDILILADFFQCDYRFFISNERLAPFEQAEYLYRRHGDAFSKEDRKAIQEFFFLCECEAFLISELEKALSL